MSNNMPSNALGCGCCRAIDANRRDVSNKEIDVAEEFLIQAEALVNQNPELMAIT
jgi:hypothetical protein